MTEAFYKVGDILEFTAVIPRQFGLRTGPVRGLVIKISNPEHEYLFYRLLVSGPIDDANDMMIYVVPEKDIVSAAKRVGHIDISLLRFEEKEQEEPDYEKMMAAYACVESANLRKLLAEETLKRKQAEAECEEKVKENERLGNENRDLKTMNDELRKSIPEYNKLILEHIACTEKIKKLKAENEPLKRENEELRAANERLAEVGARYLKGMIEAAKHIHEALCNK